MAVINQGILGGFKGKVANVIGTSWKGKAVMKSRPLSVANPRTSGQTEQRTKFSSIVAVGSSILGYTITPVWNRLASQMSGFNMFIQANSQNAFVGIGQFVPTGIKFSPVTGGDQALLLCNADKSSKLITVTWSSGNKPVNAMDSDRAFLVCMDVKGNVIALGDSNVSRGDEVITATPSRELILNEVVFAYLYFQSADQKRVFGQSFIGLPVQA